MITLSRGAMLSWLRSGEGARADALKLAMRHNQSFSRNELIARLIKVDSSKSCAWAID